MSGQALLIALPPSEGKAAGGDGAPLDLSALSDAGQLTTARAKVLAELVKLTSDAADGRRLTRARTVLGLTPGLAGEVAVDAQVLTAPTLPAAARYTGVLYDHLSLSTLPASARRRAQASVVTVSGLWGAVRPADPIPAYRLAMGVTLPRIGKLSTFWKPHLTAALPDDALVVDCRSAAYAAAWRPGPQSTVVGVRVFTVSPDGTRTVVSHMAKATRGDVSRALLLAKTVAGTPEEVATVVTDAGLECELVEPARGGAPWFLDVLLEPLPGSVLNRPAR